MFSTIIVKFLSSAFLLTGLILNQSGPIKIESLESKNKYLKPVFNKISLKSSWSQDIWQMDQSHSGENPPEHLWERLYIVVDKSKVPYEASYYQLKTGSSDFKERIEFRASCYTCHANGPRFIRPNSSKLTLKEKLIIGNWNLKIESYGKILPDKKNLNESQNKVRFWFTNEHENETLKVKTCLFCHNDGQWPNRSKIKRQQVGTMQFLVNNHFMPPLGFKLSKEELNEVNDFINGF